MIYLRPSAAPWQLRQEDLVPELSASGEPLEKLTLREDERIIAYAAVFKTSANTCALVFRMEKDETSKLLPHAFSIAANYVIRRYHPDKIRTFSTDPRIKRIAPDALFYPKGRVFIREVEPWRYKISDECFDQEGYIIHQGLMKPLPFGWFSTKDKGCGWIAAYNLLKLAGREQTMQETAEGLSRWGVAGEYFGENFFLLVFYLFRKGLQVKTAYGKKACIALMKKSKYGILLYSYGTGSHYSAYRVRSDGSCYFYNVIYGRSGYVQNPESFFKTHGKGWKAMLLGVPRSVVK
ncbi:MAG: hypothetical protein IKE16_09310 [Solobacterium sp.]|nr:hypothetical protein [Solobacterium sp.]